MENIIVSFRDVNIKHDGNLVLKDINLDVAKGEFVYLIGKTGSGKSSILKTIYADLTPESGTIRVAGYSVTDILRKDVPFLRRKLGIVFQDFELLTDRTVADNLMFVMEATGWSDKAIMNSRIDELLNLVGILENKNKMPHQLSGGEQQRLTLARALVNNPQVLIADEPTGNLDPVIAHEILNLLVEINQKGTAIIMATHYHSFLKVHPARVIYCENAQLQDISKKQVLQRMDMGKE